MVIFIIGQCTLHWGRMEFGNIGNYYIIEPFVRELKRVFPEASLKTTMQMSTDFCSREGVEVLPMALYYDEHIDNKEIAERELTFAKAYDNSNRLEGSTPFIDEVLSSDLVIDFSGDIWGDNADFLGKDRFYVGLCKNRVAQLLHKKTVMLAGSPGPFSEPKNIDFAKEVFLHFDLVTNRERLSREVLKRHHFKLDHVHDLACPAFLFVPRPDIDQVLQAENLINREKLVVGFIVCGWNFLEGPFDKWPRNDADYQVFVEAIEYLDALGAKVVLMSHANGFIPGKEPFQLIHGRDYPIIKQLQKIIDHRGIAKHVSAIDHVYDAWTTKALIGKFDMLVSGRVHAAVAALSQSVPTVIIDYGHEPKAHKLKGFAIEAGAEEYVADPSIDKQIHQKIKLCWDTRDTYRSKLNAKMPVTKKRARENFDLLNTLF